MDKRKMDESVQMDGRESRKKAKSGTAGAQHAATLALPLYKHVKNNVYSRLTHDHHDTWIVYENEKTMAILEPRPCSPGHVVVVVKEPAATVLEAISDECIFASAKAVQDICRALQKTTSCAGIKVIQSNGPAAGQTVPQLHYHILPCYSDADWSLKEGPDRPELQDAEAGNLVAKLRNALPSTYAPGFHGWAGSSDEMEALGHCIQTNLCKPGHVVLMNGQLGAGKSTLARGVVRAFCGDPSLDVPSPTFLLCLTYEDDLAHDEAAKASHSRPRRIHHMDPYRLGAKSERFSGLLDWSNVMQQDMCLIEWPDRMPAEVLALATKGVTVRISGYGSQGAGRLVSITGLPGDDASVATLDSWRSAGPPPAATTWRSNTQHTNNTKSLTNGNATGNAISQRLQLPSTDPSEWIVLGIESSCDDTAAAVVKGDGTILAHEIASQAGIHEVWGGVKPDAARDAHAAAIVGTVDSCLSKAGITAAQLTAVAVTIGPGLSLCLQVGVRHALTLAAQHNKAVVPVHHMEAHALMARMPTVNEQPVKYPALLLLVSGGHNMLVLCSGVGKYRIIGTTLDDSVGECFDKTARLLGFSAIPGGPLLEKLANQGKPVHKITMPMQNGAHKDSCNFSFSGLKTSVGRLIDETKAQLGINSSANISMKIDQDGHITAAISQDPNLQSQPDQQESQGNGKQRGGRKQGKKQGSQPGSLEVSRSATPALQQASATPSEAGNVETNVTGQQGVGANASSDVPMHDVTSAATHQESVGQVSEAAAAAPQLVDLSPETCSEYVQHAADIASSFTQVAVRFLQQRTSRALEWLKDDTAQQACEPISCLVVAGGVAANTAIRTGLTEVATRYGIPCVCPPVKYCTDNGLMVAWTGVERLKLGLYQSPPAIDRVEQNIDVLPRWPLGPVDPRSAAAASSKIYH